MTKDELLEFLRRTFVAGRDYGRAEVMDLWDVQENRLADYTKVVEEVCLKMDWEGENEG